MASIFTSGFDGVPLRATLAKTLGRAVDYVEIVPDSLAELPQSTSCRVLCSTGDCFFVKRVMGSQQAENRRLASIRGDLLSNRNELRFYVHNFADRCGVMTPKALLATAGDCAPSTKAAHRAFFLDDILDRDLASGSTAPRGRGRESTRDDEAQLRRVGFLFILEDLGGPQRYQRSPLTLPDVRRSLSALAELHASTWGRRALLRDAATVLHAHGGYWGSEKRGPSEVTQCHSNWAAFVAAFASIDREFDEWCGTGEVRDLGARLAGAAKKVDRRMRVAWDSKHACLIHGDAKALNMFFDRGEPEATGHHGVTLIDFQWTGIGVGASDVAMHIAHACDASLLSELDYRGRTMELQLLAFYHSELVRRGVAEYSLEALLQT
jgi:hypothetical protein